MALGEVGNVLGHADPRHGEIVATGLERERSRDREALDAHAERRIRQRSGSAASGTRGIGAERLGQIVRASGRERVCQYWSVSVGAGSLKNKNRTTRMSSIIITPIRHHGVKKYKSY